MVWQQLVGLSTACVIYGLWSWYNQPDDSITPEVKRFRENMAKARDQGLQALLETLEAHQKARKEKSESGQENQDSTAYIMLFFQPASWLEVEKKLQALKIDNHDIKLNKYINQLKTLIQEMRKANAARLECLNQSSQDQLQHRQKIEEYLTAFETKKNKIKNLSSYMEERNGELRKTTDYLTSYRPHLKLFLDFPQVSMDTDLENLWIKIEPYTREEDIENRVYDTSTYSIKAAVVFSFKEKGWVDDKTKLNRIWMNYKTSIYSKGTPGWEEYASLSAKHPKTTTSWVNNLPSLTSNIIEAFNKRD